MINGWVRYHWTMSNRFARLYNMEKRVVGISKKGYTSPRVKGSDWFIHSNGESPKSVGGVWSPTVRPRKSAAHETHCFGYKKII